MVLRRSDLHLLFPVLACSYACVWSIARVLLMLMCLCSPNPFATSWAVRPSCHFLGCSSFPISVLLLAPTTTPLVGLLLRQLFVHLEVELGSPLGHEEGVLEDLVMAGVDVYGLLCFPITQPKMRRRPTMY